MQVMKGGQLPNQLQKAYLERLVRGQERLELGIEELQESLKALQQRETTTIGIHQVSTTESHSVQHVTLPDAIGSLPAAIDYKTSSVESFQSTLIDGTDSHAAAEGLELVLPPREPSRRQDWDLAGMTAGHGSPFQNLRNGGGSKPHAVFEEFIRLVEQAGYSDDNPNLQPCAAEVGAVRGHTVELYNGGIGQSTKLASTGFVIHPASTLSVSCDGLRLVFMLIDMVLVPYVIAWNPDSVGWLLYLSFCITVYWSVDVLLNFNTGYIQEGKVVLQRILIAKRYVASAFIIDMCVLCVEYVDLLLAESSFESGSVGSGALFRMLKFLKVARFIRIVARLRSGLLARMQTSILRWLQYHELLDYLTVVNYAQLVVKVVFLIAILGHIGSCAWHLLETVLATHPDSWQEDPRGEMPQYMRGFYWSLSTMFSGASDLYPLNLGEGILSAVWLVLGMVFVTSITSAMSAAFIEGHVKQQEMTKKMQALTTYLDQRKTPILLSLAVINEFSRKVFEPKKLFEQDVPLHLISPSLRSSLRDAHFASGFLRLPFFRMISTMRHGLLQELCFTAAEIMVVPGGQDVFTARQEMEHAMLLTLGNTIYSKARGRSTFASSRIGLQQQSTFENYASQKNGEGTWFCELALILQWKAIGTVTSESDCELLVVSSEHFIQVVMNYTNVAVVVSAYSVELCRQMREGSLPKFNDVDPNFDCDAVVSDLPHIIKSNLVSRPVLHIMRKQALQGRGVFQGPRKNILDLEDEVQVGKCHLVVGHEGAHGATSITRVVRIVVLHLTNQDGLYCVQIGQSRLGQCDARFTFPGSKCGASESPEDCLARLLKESLSELSPAIRVVDKDTIVEYESSLSYGIQTKYIKTIFMADLHGTLYNETGSGDNTVTLTGHLGGERAKRSFGLGNFKMDGTHSETRLFTRWFECLGDGPNHGFAFQNKVEKHSSASSHLEKVQVFQWLQKDVFDTLNVHRKKVEEELAELFKHQTSESWERLLSWRLQADVPREHRAGPSFLAGSEDLPGSALDSAPVSRSATLPSGECSPVTHKMSRRHSGEYSPITHKTSMRHIGSVSSLCSTDTRHAQSKKDGKSTPPSVSKAHVKTWIA
mmetsp:Transcript_50598/g.118177  ORF Transcript_50598/g.118177 Transcript_50598/m.118177 type:complete len:1105 (-) Transcript_50598:39-3353(-)